MIKKLLAHFLIISLLQLGMVVAVGNSVALAADLSNCPISKLPPGCINDGCKDYCKCNTNDHTYITDRFNSSYFNDQINLVTGNSTNYCVTGVGNFFYPQIKVYRNTLPSWCNPNLAGASTLLGTGCQDNWTVFLSWGDTGPMSHGDCVSSAGTRICARAAYPGRNGNRTIVCESRYHNMGDSFVNKDGSGNDSTANADSKGDYLTNVRITANQSCPSDGAAVCYHIVDAKAGADWLCDLRQATGNGAGCEDPSKYISGGTANPAVLNSSVSYKPPPNGNCDYRYMSMTADSSAYVYHDKRSHYPNPRAQICAYEDPLDGSDVNWSSQPWHANTPSSVINSIATAVASNQSITNLSGLAGTVVGGTVAAGSTIGVGVAAVTGLAAATSAGMEAAFTTAAIATEAVAGGISSSGIGVIVGVVLAIVGALVAAFGAIYAAIWQIVNRTVLTQNDSLGCVDLPLGPFPPPFNPPSTPTAMSPFLFKTCSGPNGDLTTCGNNYLLGGSPKYFSLATPYVYLEMGNIYPICTATTTNECAVLKNLGNDVIASGVDQIPFCPLTSGTGCSTALTSSCYSASTQPCVQIYSSNAANTNVKTSGNALLLRSGDNSNPVTFVETEYLVLNPRDTTANSGVLHDIFAAADYTYKAEIPLISPNVIKVTNTTTSALVGTIALPFPSVQLAVCDGHSYPGPGSTLPGSTNTMVACTSTINAPAALLKLGTENSTFVLKPSPSASLTTPASGSAPLSINYYGTNFLAFLSDNNGIIPGVTETLPSSTTPISNGLKYTNGTYVSGGTKLCLFPSDSSLMGSMVVAGEDLSRVLQSNYTTGSGISYTGRVPPTCTGTDQTALAICQQGIGLVPNTATNSATGFPYEVLRTKALKCIDITQAHLGAFSQADATTVKNAMQATLAAFSPVAALCSDIQTYLTATNSGAQTFINNVTYWMNGILGSTGTTDYSNLLAQATPSAQQAINQLYKAKTALTTSTVCLGQNLTAVSTAIDKAITAFAPAMQLLNLTTPTITNNQLYAQAFMQQVQLGITQANSISSTCGLASYWNSFISSLGNIKLYAGNIGSDGASDALITSSLTNIANISNSYMKNGIISTNNALTTAYTCTADQKLAINNALSAMETYNNNILSLVSNPNAVMQQPTVTIAAPVVTSPPPADPTPPPPPPATITVTPTTSAMQNVDANTISNKAITIGSSLSSVASLCPSSDNTIAGLISTVTNNLNGMRNVVNNYNYKNDAQKISATDYAKGYAVTALNALNMLHYTLSLNPSYCTGSNYTSLNTAVNSAILYNNTITSTLAPY